MSISDARPRESDLVRLSVVHVWVAVEEPSLGLAWGAGRPLRTSVLLVQAAVRVGIHAVAVGEHLVSAYVQQQSVEET